MTLEILTLLPSWILVGTSLFSQLPSIAFPIILVAILILIVLILWFIWSRPSSPSSMSDIPVDHLTNALSASTRPLFANTEASLFNMVRLAVQDRYLVLAQLPLSSVFTIEEKDRESRKAIMKAIQHIRIDLALIHPGTLQLEKIIRFTTPDSSSTPTPHKEQIVLAILESAGIPSILLDANASYTVPELLMLLGLGEED